MVVMDRFLEGKGRAVGGAPRWHAGRRKPVWRGGGGWPVGDAAPTPGAGACPRQGAVRTRRSAREKPAAQPERPVAAGNGRCFGFAEARMASAVSSVVHQSEAIGFPLSRCCNSRWPSHAMHGTAMELPIAL